MLTADVLTLLAIGMLTVLAIGVITLVNVTRRRRATEARATAAEH
jgi:Flp pilus assembly protein protease CpaA